MKPIGCVEKLRDDALLKRRAGICLSSGNRSVAGIGIRVERAITKREKTCVAKSFAVRIDSVSAVAVESGLNVVAVGDETAVRYPSQLIESIRCFVSYPRHVGAGDSGSLLTGGRQRPRREGERTVCDIYHRTRIGINVVGRSLCLMIGNILPPEHRSLIIDDDVIGICRLPNQHTPRGDDDARLGREVHLFGSRCRVTGAERRFEICIGSAACEIESCRVEFDMPRCCGDRDGRIAEVG